MLHQVQVTDFDKIKDIVLRNIEECRAGKRTSYDYVKATATLFSSQGNVGIWVDDIDSPTCLLIVTKGKFGVLNETFAFVNTIYVDKDKRTPSLFTEMAQTAEVWARSNGCDSLQGSAWVYEGCDDCSRLWEKEGFSIQEKIYVKGLR